MKRRISKSGVSVYEGGEALGTGKEKTETERQLSVPVLPEETVRAVCMRDGRRFTI